MTVSLLVASGVDIATATAILGHKNASVLLDVYAQAPKRAAGKLEASSTAPPAADRRGGRGTGALPGRLPPSCPPGTMKPGHRA